MTDESFQLIAWLLSSFGGLLYAVTHWWAIRRIWAGWRWKGQEVESAAAFHRRLSRGLLFYFVVNSAAGVVAVFGPTWLIAWLLVVANIRILLLVQSLKRYERQVRER